VSRCVATENGCARKSAYALCLRRSERDAAVHVLRNERRFIRKARRALPEALSASGSQNISSPISEALIPSFIVVPARNRKLNSTWKTPGATEIGQPCLSGLE